MSIQYAHHRPLTPITPMHSPHPSAGSSIRIKTPGQLSLHEYRKMQVTPSPPAIPGQKTVKKRRAMSSLSRSESMPAKSPTQTFMPSFISLSTPPLTPSIDAGSEYNVHITPANTDRVTNPKQASRASTYPELSHLLSFDAWLRNSSPTSPPSSHLPPLSASLHARSTSSLYQPPTPGYHVQRSSPTIRTSRPPSSGLRQHSRQSSSLNQFESAPSVAAHSEVFISLNEAQDIQRSRSLNEARASRPRSSIIHPSTTDSSNARGPLGSPISIADTRRSSRLAHTSASIQRVPQHKEQAQSRHYNIQSHENLSKSTSTEQPKTRVFKSIKRLPRPDSTSKSRPTPLTLSSSSFDALYSAEDCITSSSTFSLSKFPFPRPPLHTTAPRSQLRFSAPATTSSDEKQNLLHSHAPESPSVRFSGANFDLLNTRRSFNFSDLGDISPAESDFSPTAHLLENESYSSDEESARSEGDLINMSDEPPRSNLPRAARYSNLESAHRGVMGSPATPSRETAVANFQARTDTTNHNNATSHNTNGGPISTEDFDHLPDSTSRLPRNEVRQRQGYESNAGNIVADIQARIQYIYSSAAITPSTSRDARPTSPESDYSYNHRDYVPGPESNGNGHYNLSNTDSNFTSALYDSSSLPGLTRPGTPDPRGQHFNDPDSPPAYDGDHLSIFEALGAGLLPGPPSPSPYTHQNNVAPLRNHGSQTHHNEGNNLEGDPVRPANDGLVPDHTYSAHHRVDHDYERPTEDNEDDVGGRIPAYYRSYGPEMIVPPALSPGFRGIAPLIEFQGLTHDHQRNPRYLPPFDVSESPIIPAPLIRATLRPEAPLLQPRTPNLAAPSFNANGRAVTPRTTLYGSDFDSQSLYDDDARNRPAGRAQGITSYSDIGDDETSRHSGYYYDPARASDPFEYDRVDNRTSRPSGTLSNIIEQYGRASETTAVSSEPQQQRIVAATQVQRLLAAGTAIRDIPIADFEDLEDINRAIMDLATVPFASRHRGAWFMPRYIGLLWRIEVINGQDFACEQEAQWEDRGMPMEFRLDAREASATMPIFVLPYIGGPHPGDELPPEAALPHGYGMAYGSETPRAIHTPGPAPIDPVPPTPSHQNPFSPRNAYDSSIQSHETTSRLLAMQASPNIPRIWSCRSPMGSGSYPGCELLRPESMAVSGPLITTTLSVTSTNVEGVDNSAAGEDDHDWETVPSRPTSLLPGFVHPAQLSSEPNEDIVRFPARFEHRGQDIELGIVSPVPTATIGSVARMSSLRPLITGPRRFLAMPTLTRHPAVGMTTSEARNMRHTVVAVWVFAWIPFIPLLMGYGAFDECLGWEVSRRDKYVARIVGWTGLAVVLVAGSLVLAMYLAGLI